MTAAVFRAMALALSRDRGALAMSVALPVAFFLVFAAVFTGAAGAHLRLDVALCDELRSEESRRLLAALGREPALVLRDAGSCDAARALVRRGEADVGLAVRRDAEPFGSLGGFGRPPLLLLVDPSKAVSADMLRGLVQRAYFRALPDVALGGVASFLDSEMLTLTDEQRRALGEGLADVRRDALAGAPSSAGLEELFEAEAAAGTVAGRNHVAYSAGAVAVLFLFFSTVHGALSLHDERASGVVDRALAGPGGVRPLVLGKLLFLAAQGFVQVAILFAVAWAVHGVDLPGRLGGFALVTAAAAGTASALALLLVAACRTRRQAQTVANVVILIMSAVGGSMVPRFFMPPLLRQAGWLTPTTWAVEAYAGVFWRGEGMAALALPVGLLAGVTVLATAAALALSARWERV